ncbi:MAG: HD domain-containing protein [Gemmatimonadota bacterium]
MTMHGMTPLADVTHAHDGSRRSEVRAWTRTAPIAIASSHTDLVAQVADVLGSEGYLELRISNSLTELAALLAPGHAELVVVDLRDLVGHDADLLEQALFRAGGDAPCVVGLNPGPHRGWPDWVCDPVPLPLDAASFTLRVENLLLTRQLESMLMAGRRLESGRRAEASRAEHQLLRCLARAGEFRNDVSGAHAERVGDLSAMIARALDLDPGWAESLRHAAPLHDLGTLGIPDRVLFKAEPLTPDEFGLMRLHTSIGESILAGAEGPLVDLARSIALNHHERWDGRGYPRGLSGTEIPLEARIAAVADTFDAILHTRDPDVSLADAAGMIAEESEGAFDPAVVTALDRVIAEGLAETLYLYV